MVQASKEVVKTSSTRFRTALPGGTHRRTLDRRTLSLHFLSKRKTRTGSPVNA